MKSGTYKFQAMFHIVIDIMDYILAGEHQQQTNQPNDQAGNLPN